MAQVLAVCTANQCRSPMTELFLRQAVAADPAIDWVVGSAGTQAVPGRPLVALARDVLEARGLTTGSFESRRLTSSLIDAADLVLTAEASHRAVVVSLSPKAVHRTFTLKQFVRLLRASDADASTEFEGTARLIERARAARSRSQAGDDGIADPTGLSRAHFEATAATVESAVDGIVSIYRAQLEDSLTLRPTATL